MSKERIKDFIDKQLENLDNFSYKLEEDENHIYAIFTEILSKYTNKELTFKLLDDVLYLHSITYGWKPVEKGVANKYFWLEILNKA
ncbi:hypothetical protein [Arcobacter cloacae]|uniref:Uncharacterized protein n=1 Tax=Arcobacter cloacae TaxID=1054034 RepID=A0A4Q0V4E3_9BACT|nr:hypothetical protein [Arcobacter cloacae]NCB12524.1 hypothetical protein [Erysipelotrichia bacterium]QKF88569.1 hypothetical protein ACLO_0020 [Arcobacter cloacae]RXI41242.1 hypothetical protein CP963_07545 [Arcobacter cloacae]RXJ85024.1 hypothetical protein CRU90_03450 [Arcobacter cloacae]